MSAETPQGRKQRGGGTSILVVDDDRVLRESLCRAFARRGFDARGAADYDEAVASASQDPPELAVVDLRMPGGSGLDLVRVLRAQEPETRIVVLTGYGSIATAVEAVRLGASNFLPKPADADDILNAFGQGEGAGASSAGAARSVPSLARVEWEHIHRVLSDSGGNVSEAARRLGMHRRSLQRKLQKRPPRN
jgi:two-component system response regulator RegA